MSARRTPSVVVAAVVAVLVASASAALLGSSSDRSSSARATAETSGVMLAHGSDRLPSQTAADWVTYADHVVVATAVSDRETPPDASEIAIGEGLVGRSVQMRLDRVLWSSASAPVAAPSTWRRPSMGWAFSGGVTKRSEIALAHSPRVEAGHTYVVALDWVEDPCAPGSGEWLELGEGSTVGFDGGAFGVGEYEGRTRTRAETMAAATGSHAAGAHAAETGLEAQLAGRGHHAIADALARARQVPAAERFPVTVLTCEDGPDD